jgi:hypothetical protein
MTAAFSNLPSFFDTFSSSASSDLLTLQLSAGQLEPSGGTVTVTNPIVPDRNVADRLNNFDPEIYDLRPQSHIMKLLKVLLGGSGAGGLRKQSGIARLQNTLSGMHFLDLDRFYGALFGIQRTGVEVQIDDTFDPYHDAATSDTWDDIHARDSFYRDRLIKFAKTIYSGGSAYGLRAMAEALIGSECNLYESWEWVDEENNNVLVIPNLVYTYTFLGTSPGVWSGLEQHSWADWGGGTVPFAGRTGQKNRGEFILQSKKNLSLDEQYEVTRVLNTFKPQGTQFTVSQNGLVIQEPITLRGVAADSEYWEIISTVIPNPQNANNPYGTTDFTSPNGTNEVIQKRPAFSQYQGEDWTYNNNILAVASYTIDDGIEGTTSDDEVITYSDGTSRTYTVGSAVMLGAQAISARITGDGVMTSTPYAPVRSSLNTATVGIS